MRVLVTGGSGYKGSVLVPKLLAAGHIVTSVDTRWFGHNLPEHQNLYIVEQDIRKGVACENQDAVIHLAGIANDPCGELDAKLTWEVNVLATLGLAESAVRAGVKQFIFASSASVYGVKGNAPVVEDTSLEPVSDYNKTKMCAERVLLSYADKMAVQIIRPATVCGVSPRMRLDVVVNALTALAKKEKEIKVMTPDLFRPHIHIEDVTDLYCWMLDRPTLTGCFNAGFENQTIMDTALAISKRLKVPVTASSAYFDKRSYRVSSKKLLDAGFRPKHTVAMAITEIAKGLETGSIVDDERAYNLKYLLGKGIVAGHRQGNP